MENFKYEWHLKDANFTKDKGGVFSCFSCSGGSTMGYKLAGFDVLGCNEIDKKMMQIYIKNHNPKYSFLEPIQTFKNSNDIPSELYDLDILDGSPPCSSFSLCGNREKDWGKEKKFAEGQSLQVLDTLFFDFIDLAKRLQPKVVIAENVKGLLMAGAKKYVREIYNQFDLANYYVQHFLLNASKMGVPQRRERVFFVALRKDLASQFMQQKDLFSMMPKLELNFNFKEIPYKDIEDLEGQPIYKTTERLKIFWEKCRIGNSFDTVCSKKQSFNAYKIDPEKTLKTITSNDKQRLGAFHYAIPRHLTRKEILLASSFPLDFECQKPYYVCGMSVPPVMMANIANEVYNQWLSKL